MFDLRSAARALSLPVLIAALALPACGGEKAGSAASGSAAAKASAKASGSAAAATAKLTPPKDAVAHGQPFSVEWAGPNGPEDYIDLVDTGRAQQVGDERSYVKTSAGNPAKLTAPDQPGQYDVRYVQDAGDRKVIAHVTITVN